MPLDIEEELKKLEAAKALENTQLRAQQTSPQQQQQSIQNQRVVTQASQQASLNVGGDLLNNADRNTSLQGADGLQVGRVEGTGFNVDPVNRQAIAPPQPPQVGQGSVNQEEAADAGLLEQPPTQGVVPTQQAAQTAQVFSQTQPAQATSPVDGGEEEEEELFNFFNEF